MMLLFDTLKSIPSDPLFKFAVLFKIELLCELSKDIPSLLFKFALLPVMILSLLESNSAMPL